LEKIEMKKTLVAVAALAAVAGAHAEVSITGLLDAAFTITSRTTTLGNGFNGGDEFTLNVSEDVGGGVKAIGAFTIIGSMINNNTTSAPNFRTYNSFVGLGGDFGSLKLGSQWNPTFLASTISDPTGRWGSAITTNPAELQNNGSVTYTSPSISGVSLSYQKQMLGAGVSAGSGQANAVGGSGDASAYGLNYATGHFAAAYAAATDVTNGNSNILAASYDFGVAKLHFGNLTHKTAAGVSSSGTSLGVSAPVGNAVISGVWGSGTGSVTSSNYQVVYNLSKSAAVYANSAATGGTTTNTIGMKYAF